MRTDTAGMLLAITLVVSVGVGSLVGICVGYVVEWWLARRA